MRRKTDLLAVLLAVTSAACNRGEVKTSAVGDSLRPFIIKNTETGLQYCQVCAYAGKPTLMAVRDVADQQLDQDLQKLQKILDANKEKGVHAFAVVGKVDGKNLLPLAADQTRAKPAGVEFPLVILATKLSEAEEKNYAKFAESYALPGPRTVWLANADGKIVYAGQTGGEDSQLEAAIRSL